MVKEFQQLRKQMTQTLLKHQAQQKEIATIVTKNEAEKVRLFLDVISIIETIEKKEELALRNQRLTHLPKQNSSEIYNNIKNDLIKLLTKQNVHPIPERSIFSSSVSDDETVIPKKNIAVPLKVRYLYQGKVIND